MSIDLRAASDLDATLGSLAVEGRALEPLQLVALANFLASVDGTAEAIRRVKDAVILRGIVNEAAAFDHETADIRRKIDPSGDVVDDASPELRTLRDRLRKQRTRLRGTLESYLRGKDTAKYLQQQVVTDRNGRYVLVVRSEHRAAIPGIVHGSSGSGASLFLEPLSTVEINNDIVALEQQEQEEVRRILLALSDAFRRRAGELQRTVDAATELDVLQARARFSILVDGVEPGPRHGWAAGAAGGSASAADPGCTGASGGNGDTHLFRPRRIGKGECPRFRIPPRKSWLSPFPQSQWTSS